MIDVGIKGIQEARNAALQALAALQPDGAFGDAIEHVTSGADRYAVAHTPVATGSWRASNRPVVTGLSGRVFIDPSAVNPKSGSKPSIYGPILEARGGRYAVYEKTVQEAGPGLVQEGEAIIIKGLPS